MELTKIKDISVKRAEDLNKLGIYSTADLIKYFPKRYLDLRERQSLKNIYHNDIALTVGQIVSVPQTHFYSKKSLVKVYCEQEGLPFTAIWFNQPYVLSKLKPGQEYLFYGRVQKKFGEISIVNPSFETLDKNYRLKGIVPQYVVKGSLTQKVMRDATRLSVNLEKPVSIIPDALQKN